MARKRNNFTQSTQARILALMGAGGTADSIAKQLTAEGVEGASRATVGRRMRELEGLERKSAPRRPPASSPRAPADASLGAGEIALPETPEDIPAGTALEMYDLWLKRAEEMYEDAQGRKDFDGVVKAGRLSQMYLEGKRKATPIKEDDPNDHPDMIAMGARVATELHKLIDKVLP